MLLTSKFQPESGKHLVQFCILAWVSFSYMTAMYLLENRAEQATPVDKFAIHYLEYSELDEPVCVEFIRISAFPLNCIHSQHTSLTASIHNKPSYVAYLISSASTL